MKAVLITSSILVLVMAALRPLLRGRSSPLVQYALWLIVAVRLLIPWEAFPSAHSALALLNRAEESTHMAQAIGQTTVPILAMSHESAVIQAYQEYGEHSGVIRLDPSKQVQDRAEELVRGPTLAELAAKYARPVWLGGGLVMGLWFLLVNLRLRRKLRRALPVEADCPLPVYVSPELPSPCLCGVFRPAVYVTPAALADGDRLRHVLAHERTHFRHGDHWWALVRCLCLCVYWFDPLVWWAAAMSRQDCELACDEGAIRRLGEEERIPYGRTLVAMIAAGRTPLLQTATTMTGGKRRVKERVELIARRPRTVIALGLATALVLGLTVGFTFTGAPEESGAKTPDSLRERLEDIPEELKDEVKTSYLSEEVKGGTLVCYYLPAMLEDMEYGQEEGTGLWTLSVSRWSQAQFDAHGYPDSNDTTGRELFARDSRYYYAIDRPFDTLIERNGWESYRDTFDAIQTFAMQTVLETEGVEPFAMRTALETEGVEPFDIREVLAGSPPTEAQKTVQTVADQLMAAPSVSLSLDFRTLIDDARNSTVSDRHDYYADPAQEFDSSRLSDLAASFSWEEFDWGTTEDPHFPRPPRDGAQLRIMLPEDYSVQLTVWESTDLVHLHDGTSCGWYHARYAYPGKYGYDDTTLFEYLRMWFDVVELNTLRSASVPDRGQSHQEIVEEWIGGYEGAFLKCAPGSAYACTYVQAKDVQADSHSWMGKAALDEFAQSRGRAGDDYGKTWFTFNYSLMFVPVDQTTDSYFWAGNTEYYEGGDAPEGALAYSRVGCMELIDGNWICEGVGTGW